MSNPTNKQSARNNPGSDGRERSFADRCIGELDTALRVIAAPAQSQRPSPGAADAQLANADKAEVARLMRVNHSGEIAAQALYRGQALVAGRPDLREHLLEAAEEEHDHLAWCQDRAEQLGGGTSKLAPLWYAGSFAIGMAAGLTGDRTSLGFLAETEKQVAEHLDGHLERLPAEDEASRAILQQMREDEVHHGQGALDKGGAELPEIAKNAMRLTARIMTTLSYRV